MTWFNRKAPLPAAILAIAVATANTYAAPSSNNLASNDQASNINWNNYKGKLVLIDFWASWCSACRQSFPWMEKMQEKYGKDGLEIITINLDKERAKADEFSRDMKPNFKVFYDPQGKLASEFKVETMPSSFILGRDGKPAAKHLGFFTSKQAEYEAQLQKLLAAK